MRDILSELEGRAARLKAEIGAENARFAQRLRQLEANREGALQHLRAQLRLARKLLEFTAWQDSLRAALAGRIAAAETAETLLGKSCETAAPPEVQAAE